MGFFSWLTSDTKESIANIHSGHENAGRTVYMLQPDGKPPVAECAYNGYGMFGGVDAYGWLAEMNVPELCRGADPDTKRRIGVNLDVGSFWKDPKGEIWSFNSAIPGVRSFSGTYRDPEPEFGGKTPKEAIRDGYLTEADVKELLLKSGYRPLKFSFDPDAVYEELPAAENDPAQGFFY